MDLCSIYFTFKMQKTPLKRETDEPSRFKYLHANLTEDFHRHADHRLDRGISEPETIITDGEVSHSTINSRGFIASIRSNRLSGSKMGEPSRRHNLPWQTGAIKPPPDSLASRCSLN